MVNELFAANNGLLISSMLDSNIEIPIRLKGISNSSDLTGGLLMFREGQY